MGHFIFIEDDDDDEEIIDLELDNDEFQFEEDIPDKRTLADPHVQAKAAQSRTSRKRRTKTKDYAGKREDGWSYCCAHKDHLPNLCEREQTREGLTCTCPCHEDRGFNLDDSIRRYEDEEIIDLFA